MSYHISRKLEVKQRITDLVCEDIYNSEKDTISEKGKAGILSNSFTMSPLVKTSKTYLLQELVENRQHILGKNKEETSPHQNHKGPMICTQDF